MAHPTGCNYRRFLWIFILLIVISATGSLVRLPLYICIRAKPASTYSTRRPRLYDYPLRPNCGGDDPAAREDVIALLKEQLEQMKAAMDESLRRKEVQVKDVRKSAEPYRREADKCRASMMTCEAAGEMAEAEFFLEKKRTSEWERRARKRGWMNPSRVYI